jgi:hypothetical protein
VGEVCTKGFDCLTNHRPGAGMPVGSLTFAQAWRDTIHSSSLSPLPCVKVDGKWYLVT